MVNAWKKSEFKDNLNKAGYQNPEQTAKDVIPVFSMWRGLAYSIEPFVFNDGKQKDLFNMNGTIPVPYKGQYYNIPVRIWLMDTHPNNAPICYVTPTADMRIKVSMNVDHNGKVYLPYLHSWDPRRSDLRGLIQVMICAFSDEPPVYSKPKTETQSQPQSQHPAVPYPTQPYMPTPGGSANPAPPYPPVPVGGFPQANPYPRAQYPPFPYPWGNHPYSSGGSQLPFPSYPAAPNAGSNPSSEPTAMPVSDSGTGTITEEHIRASLLSAVEDKMRRYLREQSSHSRAELQILRQSQTELQAGKGRLDDILSRLAKEQEELDKNIAMLKDKEQELSKAIERLTEQDPVDVDEAVTTTAPLYKQILNAYAEEAATEDTIYYMGEALRQGVIDLDVFLKQVRTLSRKQFMLRALMQKCRLKAGLK